MPNSNPNRGSQAGTSSLGSSYFRRDHQSSVNESIACTLGRGLIHNPNPACFVRRNLPKFPLLRFFRRIPLIPGMLWLNIFKWGISLSIGQQGLRITLGRSNIRGTVGLTGTGIFLTKNWRHSLWTRKGPVPQTSAVPPDFRLENLSKSHDEQKSGKSR